MRPHELVLHLIFLFLLLVTGTSVKAQQHKSPPGSRVAVIVDERLSALRETPSFTGKLIRRLGRGRLVAVRAVKTTSTGIVFYRVNVSTRTNGWIQREALAANWRNGDDERLISLIRASSDFDRIVRARIFLNHFPRSRLRPEVLLLLGDSAALVSDKLTRDAARRIPDQPGALESSYFLNYSGLDRYNRQGVTFLFEEATRCLRYDGAAWREIISRYPRSAQAVEAQKRLLPQ